jgi:hypothetical protein
MVSKILLVERVIIKVVISGRLSMYVEAFYCV